MAPSDVHFWVLEPRTFPEDPTWQDRKIWQRVLVAAPSAAMARDFDAVRDELRTTGS